MLLQVASLKFLSNLNRFYPRLKLSRWFSSRPKKLFAEKLEKGFLKITGNESRDFLQGLITNDIRHLVDGKETSVSLPCIYSMILNVQGRLLYDVLIFGVREHSPIGNCLLLECDSEVKEEIVKMFTRYKLRKKVDVKISDDLAVYAVFNEKGDGGKEEIATDHGVVAITRDPRLPELGHRIILEKRTEISEVVDSIETTHGKYRDLRYSLGVGEGIHEHPPGDCFPLECNGDYLHGISFTKGCYLGQELTSRIHHTGVVRKRIMPLKFEQEVQYKDIPTNCPIVNDADKNVGKFRSSGPIFGIGLLRIDQVLAAKTVSVHGFGKVSTHKPSWWPLGT